MIVLGYVSGLGQIGIAHFGTQKLFILGLISLDDCFLCVFFYRVSCGVVIRCMFFFSFLIWLFE